MESPSRKRKSLKRHNRISSAGIPAELILYLFSLLRKCHGMNALFANLRFLLSVVVLFGVCGCGKVDKNLAPTAPVTGKVTYNGEPLPDGSITTRPQLDGDFGKMEARPKIHPANGKIQNGEFELSTFGSGDGATIGTHKVLIGRRDPSGMTPLIPPYYGDENTTPLTMEVTVEGPNEFTFDLQ